MHSILRFSLHIKTQAVSFGLSPSLIAAIAQKESSGDPWAVRFEPGWRYFFNVEEYAKASMVTTLTEYQLQAFSYGLMQIVGGVAREHGLKGPLPQLFDPAVNLKYGCKHLQKFIQLYGNEADAIAAYNAGSPRRLGDGMYVNQEYVTSVLVLRESFLELE